MVYNAVRAHEALGMATPSQRHAPGPRSYRETVDPFDDAHDDRLRRVQKTGRIFIDGRALHIPKAFWDRVVALRPTENDGVCRVFYRYQRLAIPD